MALDNAQSIRDFIDIIRKVAGDNPNDYVSDEYVEIITNLFSDYGGGGGSITDEEVEDAYNNQVDIVSQVNAEAGTSSIVFRWTPERVAQAIAALGGGGGASDWGDLGGTLSDQTDLQAELDKVLPTRGVLSEDTEIDCSAGSIIEMTITGAKTGGNAFTISNLPEGSMRLVSIIGNYDIEFDSGYDTDFISPLAVRGDTRLMVIANINTTASPVYAIKDAIGDYEVITIPITRYGEDASTGTKVSFPMEYPFIIVETKADVVTAPTGQDMILDINKNGTSIYTSNMQIDATETSSIDSTAYTFNSLSFRTFDAEDLLTIDVDQVGSTAAGQHIVVRIIGYKIGA